MQAGFHASGLGGEEGRQGGGSAPGQVSIKPPFLKSCNVCLNFLTSCLYKPSLVQCLVFLSVLCGADQILNLALSCPALPPW